MVLASIVIILFVLLVCFVSLAVLYVGTKETKTKKYTGKVRRRNS